MQSPASDAPILFFDSGLGGLTVLGPTRALLLSELATFLAQIEAHTGKRSVIAPGPAFEADYRVTAGIARTTWLRRDFFEPDYGAHPWAMWQANDYVRLTGAGGTVGWNVLRPEGQE